MPVPVRIGRVVQYNDANGVTLAAIITAVRDAVAGKMRLSVFNPGGTLTDVDNVPFGTSGAAPSSWVARDG